MIDVVEVVEHLQGDINFWDYICIAARLAFLPTYLIWILVTKSLTPNTRRKPWRRLLGDAAIRKLIVMDTKRLKFVMGTTPWVYAIWAKWYNLQPTITELGNEARLLWIGPKRMEKVILYLHGGAYAYPMQHFSASFWHYVQQQLESHGVKVGIGILNYTLVPTELFPMQLRQAVSAVEYLLSNGVQPENIQIVGDSAGGNIVLALLSHMLHPLDDIPPITPKRPFSGMYMMSPWVRLSTDDITSNLNDDDFDVITKPLIKLFGNVILSGLPEYLTSFIEPSLAPEGWFRGAHTYVERFLITAGDNECMRNDITEFAHRFRQLEENKETLFVIQPDGVHDDPYLDFFVSQPKLGVLTPIIVDWIHEGFN